MEPKSCPVENVELELECSYYTPGAYWVYGSEHYAIRSIACVPKRVAEAEDVEESVLNWFENLESLLDRYPL